MKRLLIRINFAARHAICFFLGHVKRNVSFRTVGLKQCLRCLRTTDHKTVRQRVTFGEVERRMAAHSPKAYSFVKCNWKKQKGAVCQSNGTFEVCELLVQSKREIALRLMTWIGLCSLGCPSDVNR
jgi:hypothetical protein